MQLKTLTCGIAVAAIGLLVPTTAAAQLGGDLTADELIASGHLGSSFGASAEEAGFGAGASLTYLRNGMLGAEFLAGFSPGLDLTLATTDDSAVGNFMVNGVAALPLGIEGRWQPFLSAGLGAMTISSELPDSASNDLFEVDDTQLGGNIGFGVMGFADQWGFRSDLRYFSGFGGEDDDDPLDLIDANDFLSDVDYWRASVGVAYRW